MMSPISKAINDDGHRQGEDNGKVGADKVENDESSSNGQDKRTTLRVAVGTDNPCKIDAVTKALRKAIRFPATGNVVVLHVEGFSVESGVPDQPFGDVRLSWNLHCALTGYCSNRMSDERYRPSNIGGFDVLCCDRRR